MRVAQCVEARHDGIELRLGLRDGDTRTQSCNRVASGCIAIALLLRREGHRKPNLRPAAISIRMATIFTAPSAMISKPATDGG